MKFVEVNPPTVMLGALAQGRIDAATPPEPIMTQSLQNDARIFGDPFAAVAPRFFIGVWIARTDWLKANPDVARRFAEAIYEAGAGQTAHRDESAAILAKYAKADAGGVSHDAPRDVYRLGARSAADPAAPRCRLQTGMLSTAVKASDLVTKGF